MLNSFQSKQLHTTYRWHKPAVKQDTHWS